MSIDKDFFDSVLNKVQSDKYGKVFDPTFELKKHDRETKWKITRLFLTWYFVLIILAFLFCLGYNWIIALLNINLLSNGMELIPYIEVSNTVSLITTTLSSGVGFVIGYYFKNDKDNL